MRFPNLIWALAQAGPRYRFAATLGESESWLSRRLTGRVEFTEEEREKIARVLGYSSAWLFLRPEPPARIVVPDMVHANT